MNEIIKDELLILISGVKERGVSGSFFAKFLKMVRTRD